MFVKCIETAQGAADFLNKMFVGVLHEKIVIVHLDHSGAVLKVSTENGYKQHVNLPIRAILFEAMQIKADAIIIAHNHPSGNAWPSKEDCAATRLLAETARALEVELRDHLIFAGGDCRSFREMGLL
ncbi:JAB domain-containing protein [Allosphingosinicella indica]|uniref:JAB domain-containing protein n=1 Tax=Allosphingosinicella indica TaxID=941907 RepID=UPI000A163136|nr:JAB domain-containing protein [Allosphingosinicella indica]